MYKFIYHALFNKPYTVFKGHKRIIDYVEDTFLFRLRGSGGSSEDDRETKSGVDLIMMFEF